MSAPFAKGTLAADEDPVEESGFAALCSEVPVEFELSLVTDSISVEEGAEENARSAEALLLEELSLT